VEKIGQRKFGEPSDARGKEKFLPPKQALVSPLTARYLMRGSGNDEPSGLTELFASCPRRSAEAGQALLGPAFPAGFLAAGISPSPGQQ
jgi:hypothetical protein